MNARTPRSRTTLATVGPPLAVGLLLLVAIGLGGSPLSTRFAVAGTPVGGNAEAATERPNSGSTDSDVPEDWNETALGSVPNRFGELFAVTQQSEAITLLFRNTDRELRLIEKAGNVLPEQTLVVTRLPDEAESPKIGAERRTDEGWTEIHSANIPAHFGTLVEMHGNRREGGVHLIFQDEDGAIRVARWNATGFEPEVRFYPREERKDGIVPPDDSTKPNRPTPQETKRKDSAWTEVEDGVLPRWLGNLLTISSKNLRFVFCFESALGDLYLVETQAGRRPNTYTQILREPLDKEGKDLRRREVAERRAAGGPVWTPHLVKNPLPSAFGEVVEAAGIPAVLLLRDRDGTDRFVTITDEIRRAFETIARDPEAKGPRKEEGWSRTEIGFVPESFGRLRALTSDPDNPKRHLYLYQSEDGVLHLVDRVGTRLKRSSLRIDREY